jgi:hypothetical protein
MTDENEHISNALGIATEVPEVVHDVKITLPAIKKDNDQLKKDEAEDYTKARETLHDLIDNGAETAALAMKVAQQGQQPRQFEAAARVMETLSGLVGQLHELQDKTRRIKSYDDPAPVDATVNVDKAVFVGTTAEMLAAYQEQKRKLKAKKDDSE